MPIGSTSTDAEIEAAYDDNADYADGDGSVEKGRNFAKACRILLRRIPASTTGDGVSIQNRIDLIQNELNRVMDWLVGHDQTSTANNASTVVFDFRGARE